MNMPPPPGYGNTPPPPGYGNVPPAPGYGYGYPPPRQRKSPRRTAVKVILIVVGVIVVLFALLVVIGFVSDSSKPKKTNSSLPPGLTPQQQSMLGPDACKVPAASGSGPFKMAAPSTLCGMPNGDDAYTKKTDPSSLATDRFNFDQTTNPGPDGPVGTPASGWIHHWNTPAHLGVYRFATVEGWTGKFNPKSAVPVFAQSYDDQLTFKPVDPGPHGGVMECAEDTSGNSDPNADNAAVCVFATSTTIGTVNFTDTAKELTAPANLAKVGQELRDALEVPAS